MSEAVDLLLQSLQLDREINLNPPSVCSENGGESSGVSKKCCSENRTKKYTSIHKSYLGRLTKYKEMWLEATWRAKLGRYKGIILLHHGDVIHDTKYE